MSFMILNVFTETRCHNINIPLNLPVRKHTNTNQCLSFDFFNRALMLNVVCLQCDIGMVYDEEKHSFINRWLLLSDPEDTLSGAKGYLKICATVLGPGDDAPVSLIVFIPPFKICDAQGSYSEYVFPYVPTQTPEEDQSGHLQLPF